MKYVLIYLFSGYPPNQFNLNRLSPQQQQQQQLVAVQQQMQTNNFQQNSNQFQSAATNVSAQLSPLTRQFQSQPGTPTGQQPPQGQWGQANTRMAANPLLSSQLSVSKFLVITFGLFVKLWMIQGGS